MYRVCLYLNVLHVTGLLCQCHSTATSIIYKIYMYHLQNSGLGVTTSTTMFFVGNWTYRPLQQRCRRVSKLVKKITQTLKYLFLRQERFDIHTFYLLIRFVVSAVLDDTESAASCTYNLYQAINVMSFLAYKDRTP